jgi:hypothetical protein
MTLCLGCVTRTQQFVIEVKRGSTVGEKLQIAKTVVTEERLTRLKGELKQKWPSLTDAQLARMGLRWNENHFRTVNTGETSTSVTVTVALDEQPGIDAASLVKTAAALLDGEINGAESGQVEQSP